ncbi:MULTISPECIES: hypothetical protein [Pseudomonas]|uniref:Uncharacterized protein n=1 Tax=Pseudomonas lini TaxID=163011 RepID=A0A0J6HD58_9PSED|nr:MULTISPECIES: hypothetical protein [Pseudomonas]KAB0508548.1 hypothetical protein F7R14_02585 [Pseudomonas lini]KMM92448.1 hypothetical protein TU81_14395 [Pseudomonas lini]KNH47352.1 hypothetical protein ACS73_06245 [Pseudomonas lini]MDT9677341.1 hypothetical protein [Pseudomonas sp. JV414]NSX11261.1 hypothetical protein [Pseudomonas lini]
MELKYYYIPGGNHPITGEVLYRAALVSSGENTERYELYICTVLNAIAQTQEDCDRLLGCITSIEDGSETSEVGGGNDVELTMDASGVQVDILINDDWVGQPEGKFTLQEWRLVLEQWRYFLGLSESLETVVTVKLS